jgi:hypothetical protein
MSRYKQIEPGRNISRLTRVNSSSNSSKTIVPRKIIKGLNLRYDDDYLEWKMEMRGGRKVAIVRKFRRGTKKFEPNFIRRWKDAITNTGYAMIIFLMLGLTLRVTCWTHPSREPCKGVSLLYY